MTVSCYSVTFQNLRPSDCVHLPESWGERKEGIVVRACSLEPAFVSVKSRQEIVPIVLLTPCLGSVTRSLIEVACSSQKGMEIGQSTT